MNRILPFAMALLIAVSASAAERFAADPDPNPAGTSIATTGRIMKIDAKNKTFKVRGSDGQTLTIRNLSQSISNLMQGVKQRIGIALPGGVSIPLPGRKNPPRSQEKPNSLEEFTVIVTDDTVLQDGVDSVRFEDFKNGETISIHGILDGSVLTAARVAKWF
jgi:hypothetical protein